MNRLYICNECDNTFEEPTAYKEDHGETLAICPYCNGGDIEDAFTCDECGEVTAESNGVSALELCNDCVDWLLENEHADMYEDDEDED